LKKAKAKPAKLKLVKKALEVKMARQRALDKQLYSDKHAKYFCRLLCETMHAKLPRELRDMVYEYLLEDDKVKVVRHKVEGCIPWEKPDAYSHTDVYLDPWIGFPKHLRSAGYLGGTVKLELAQTWYRCSTFVFDDDRDILTDFLRTDAWDVSLQSSELINHVEVHFSDRNLRTVSRNQDYTMTKLEPTFQALRQLKPSATSDIVLTIHTLQPRIGNFDIPHLGVDPMCDFMNILLRLVATLVSTPKTKGGLLLFWVPKGRHAHLIADRLLKQGGEVVNVKDVKRRGPLSG
jgi:hypothetical protein